jgi:hypothetical protein
MASVYDIQQINSLVKYFESEQMRPQSLLPIQVEVLHLNRLGVWPLKVCLACLMKERLVDKIVAVGAFIHTSKILFLSTFVQCKLSLQLLHLLHQNLFTCNI